MGIFLKSSPSIVKVNTLVSPGQALPQQENQTKPISVPSSPINKIVAPGESEQVAQQKNAQPVWERLIFAVAILVAIFFGGIYCAHDEKLADWSKILLHSFELLLGAFIGILTGEFASKKD